MVRSRIRADAGGKDQIDERRTFRVASLINSTRRYSFLSSWWLALGLMKISTPSRPIAMWGLKRQPKSRNRSVSPSLPSSLLINPYLLGVNNSSHSSTPMTVSNVDTTASPNWTSTWPVISRIDLGSGKESVSPLLDQGVKYLSSR